MHADAQHGISACERLGADGERLVFVMNFNDKEMQVALHESYTDAETGEQYEGAMEMNAYEVKVLR